MCAESCGSSLCARSRADFAEEDRAQPQPAANRLLHQVHAFDGNLALLVGRCVGETAAQLLHPRILAAVDAPQTTFELD